MKWYNMNMFKYSTRDANWKDQRQTIVSVRCGKRETETAKIKICHRTMENVLKIRLENLARV